MQQRQPHTHLTCGFCMRPKIIRSKPHETKSDDCLAKWNQCFKVPEVSPQKSFEFALT